MDINIVKLAECFLMDKNKYPDNIETERLLLEKSDKTDCTTVLYSVYLSKEEQKIGEIVLIYDGEIWCRLNEEYRKKGYGTEALEKILSISSKNHYLSIEDNNKASRKLAKKLGFKKTKRIQNSHIYRKNT